MFLGGNLRNMFDSVYNMFLQNIAKLYCLLYNNCFCDFTCNVSNDARTIESKSNNMDTGIYVQRLQKSK